MLFEGRLIPKVDDVSSGTTSGQMEVGASQVFGIAHVLQSLSIIFPVDGLNDMVSSIMPGNMVMMDSCFWDSFTKLTHTQTQTEHV
jgi:hypothetical protein